MARLIRTEKEVEGRYEEVWTVVEEDALDQWPAGPLDVVGRPAQRAGRARARARRGALHRRRRASGNAPRGGAAQPARLGSRALARPRAGTGAARRARGRRSEDFDALTDEPHFPGEAVAAVAADTAAQARAAVEAIAVEWDERAAARPRRGRRPRPAHRRDEQLLARRRRAGSRRLTSSSRPSTGPQPSSTTRWRPTRRSASGRARRSTSTSRPSTSGASATRWRRARAAARRVRVVCEFMGGGFGAKNGPGDYTLIAAELARRTGRPVRCALTRREENLAAGNRNATIQRLRVGARSDGTLVALAGEFVNAVGWSGWVPARTAPCRCSTAARTSRRRSTARS